MHKQKNKRIDSPMVVAATCTPPTRKKGKGLLCLQYKKINKQQGCAHLWNLANMLQMYLPRHIWDPTTLP